MLYYFKKLINVDIILCSHVILLGDLNYRISMPEETTRLLVEKRDWDSLLENDQVYICLYTMSVCMYLYYMYIYFYVFI